MSLVVEDGTGLQNADALIPASYFTTYAGNQGFDLSAYNTDQIEQAIRRGSQYISNAFTYEGVRSTRDQAFAFPRWGLVDLDDYEYSSTEVPARVQRATAEAAWRELQSPGSLTPDVVLSDRVKREKIGPLETEFFETPNSTSASRPDVKVIRDLLSEFFASHKSSVNLVRS